MGREDKPKRGVNRDEWNYYCELCKTGAAEAVREYMKRFEEQEERGRVMNENKLKLAKDVIAKYYKDAPWGIFPCRNDAGDAMTVLLDLQGLRIEICYFWQYFEVFGLTDKEFSELAQYYDTLCGEDE